MKIKKKTAMLVSFALGTLLLATTAVADIATKSGYDQLKDALKLTAGNCSDKFNNFTMDISIVAKDNGNILSSQNEVTKFDRIKTASKTLPIEKVLMEIRSIAVITLIRIPRFFLMMLIQLTT